MINGLDERENTNENVTRIPDVLDFCFNITEFILFWDGTIW